MSIVRNILCLSLFWVTFITTYKPKIICIFFFKHIQMHADSLGYWGRSIGDSDPCDGQKSVNDKIILKPIFKSFFFLC
jgi:hypothetical protein